MEALKHLDLNNNENIKTHGTQGRVHQTKFIALNAFIKKEKRQKLMNQYSTMAVGKQTNVKKTKDRRQ